MGIKGKGCKNTYFTRRIRTGNVCRRVCLRIALFLRLLQSGFKGNALVPHFCEYIVGSAVKYTAHLLHIVTCKAVENGMYYGNTAPCGSFVKISHAVFFRFCGKLFSVLFNHRFVGCYHAFSSADKGKRKFIGRGCSAHGLCYNSYLFIVDYVVNISGNAISQRMIGENASVQNTCY